MAWRQGRYEELKARAAQMRHDPPAAERMALQHFAQAFGRETFRHQRIVGRYIVDFLFPEEKVIVEIDGDTHAGLGAWLYDAERRLPPRARLPRHPSAQRGRLPAARMGGRAGRRAPPAPCLVLRAIVERAHAAVTWRCRTQTLGAVSPNPADHLPGLGTHKVPRMLLPDLITTPSAEERHTIMSG